MITTINNWKLFELNSNIKFENEYINFHNQQHDYILRAYVNNNLVAFAEYCEFRDKYYISMIKAVVPGYGYGKQVMLELARMYGYENIERRDLTPDGVKLRQKVDQELGFDYQKYKESQNKHIDIETIKQIKYPVLKQFLSDIVLFDYEEGWKKNIDALKQFENTTEFQNLNIDINDIAEIADWIKNSATNNNDPETDVPEYIMKELNKLL